MRRGRSDRHAEDPVDADPHQRDADHQDDRAGDHRREEPQHAAGERREQHADDAGGDDRAEDHPRALGARGGQRDRHHRPDRGEGDAHHHRQAHAEPGREAERLQDRDDPAAEEVGRDQEGDVLGRELQHPADDQRHGDGAGVHDEHVLQAEGEELRCGQHLVDGMRGCGHAAFLQAWGWLGPVVAGASGAVPSAGPRSGPSGGDGQFFARSCPAPRAAKHLRDSAEGRGGVSLRPRPARRAPRSSAPPDPRSARCAPRRRARRRSPARRRRARRGGPAGRRWCRPARG